MKKYCYIDFEYNSSEDRHPNLVSCAFALSNTYSEAVWLFKQDREKDYLANYLKGLIENEYIFVAYAVTAEARCFLALGIDPTKCKWIDLYLEYRCLTNHNHKLMYGKQLIDGKVKTTYPPKNKWDMTEDDKKRFNFSKPQHNLAAATFKLLGEVIDTDFKNTTRDIIISKDEKRIEEAKGEILEYNESDIQYLPRLLQAVKSEFIELTEGKQGLRRTLKDEMLLRGDYSARTAIMESEGYPIDYEATMAFSEAVPNIIWETQNEINTLFPEIAPFKKKKDRTFSWSQNNTRAWIQSKPFKRWLKTDTGKESLSLDAFKKYFDFKHSYPKDNFGAQMVRYLTLKQNLNGFSPTSKNSFWDNVGSDRRVRPFFNIYGAQSARSQPKATGFLFLKSAWMRSLCRPPKGKAICGIDYKSQEFLLAALLSKDENMLGAYQSGDPYLHLAKLAGAVPSEGTREEYKVERDLFKATTLGLSYGMTKIGLAVKLTADLGRKVDEEEAQLLINKFNEAYSTFHEWTFKQYNKYLQRGYVKLPCGWYMWGDNANRRSVGNVPIQGFGSSIMRKAVQLAQAKGLQVILTLHDAIYIEYDSSDINSIDTLSECMDTAFRFYFDSATSPIASVGLDCGTWSDDYEDGYGKTPKGLAFKRQAVYVDDRSLTEYQQFSKFFVPNNYEDI